MGRLPTVLPHSQTSTVTGRRSSLGPIGLSRAETTRCSDSARDARNVQGELRIQTSIPPSPDLGAPKSSPIRNHRRTQSRRAAGPAPWCSSRISANYCS